MDVLYLDVVQSHQKRSAMEHRALVNAMKELAEPDCWNPQSVKMAACYHQDQADKYAQRARDLMAREILGIPFEQRRVRNWHEFRQPAF